MTVSNALYSVAAPDSLAVRLAGVQRRKMYELFLSRGIAPSDTVLDIGATSDRTYDHSNYLELWYPRKAAITAIGVDPDAAFLEQAYPGLTFVHGDGRRLPFDDNAFDFVHSNAVIEHVGSRAQQRVFIVEALRVARKQVFITTPNRWFPVETHTVLPLVHWLPPSWFRSFLRSTGNGFHAREENLNLLSRNDLRRLCHGIGGQVEVLGVRLGGVVSNLVLCIEKS